MVDESCYEARRALIQYAVDGLDPNNGQYPDFLTAYIPLLGEVSKRETALTAILTTLKPPGPDARPANPLHLRPRQLALTPQVILHQGDENWDGNWSDAFDWDAFNKDWATLSDDPSAVFEVAAEVIRKHAWAVPGRLGQPCVSLYEEFKLLSALVHASGCSPQPAGEFTLIAGDFPGIQKAIYTITSKGAAKSLRGRSLFLQLLADGVVRRLLQELGLPWANVIYTAGGNFVILAGPDAADEADSLGGQINAGLLLSYQGDIPLVLVCETIPSSGLHGETFKECYQSIKRSQGKAKLRPFVGQVVEHWNDLFEPQGTGLDDLYCVVCHRELRKGEAVPDMEGKSWCQECEGFKQLAVDLSRHYHYLSIFPAVEHSGTGKYWQRQLLKITGYWYKLHGRPPNDGMPFFRLNDAAFREDKHRADGFRFIATRTPLNADGSIRDLEQIAKETTQGIERVGILRMDVDNLGKMFGSYIEPLDLIRLSAASAAVSLFFDGWLNMICERLEENCPDCLYLIYAGGDDLFVIGPWNLVPLLAYEIYLDLQAYVNKNSHITISAGISVIDEHYPIYRAAEAAHDALEYGAKNYVAPSGAPKNAIAMLGETVEWEPGWTTVAEQTRIMCELPKPMRNPLIRTIQALYAGYLESRRTAPQMERGQPGQMYYGRWTWMQAYSLTRLGKRYEALDTVHAIQKDILTPQHIHLAGLAARWAEYLLREK